MSTLKYKKKKKELNFIYYIVDMTSNQLHFRSIGKYAVIKLMVILALKKNGQTDFRKRLINML